MDSRELRMLREFRKAREERRKQEVVHVPIKFIRVPRRKREDVSRIFYHPNPNVVFI